jgi:hypothetical protein
LIQATKKKGKNGSSQPISPAMYGLTQCQKAICSVIVEQLGIPSPANQRVQGSHSPWLLPRDAVFKI